MSISPINQTNLFSLDNYLLDFVELYKKKRLLKISLKYDGPVEAPIKKNQKIGTYRVVYDQELIGEYDLLASNDVQKVNIFTRLIKSLNYLIWGDV